MTAGRSTLRRPVVAAALSLVLAVAVLVAAGPAGPAGAAGRGGATRSSLATAQGNLVGDGRPVEVLVSAFDFVDAGGAGTNTGVDVFFPTGECVGSGPVDFTIVGVARARLVGRLDLDCFDFETQQASAGVATIDLAWTGVGPVESIRSTIDSPPVGCRIHRTERAATLAGIVEVEAAGIDLAEAAQPAGTGFDRLARQRDACAPVGG